MLLNRQPNSPSSTPGPLRTSTRTRCDPTPRTRAQEREGKPASRAQEMLGAARSALPAVQGADSRRGSRAFRALSILPLPPRALLARAAPPTLGVRMCSMAAGVCRARAGAASRTCARVRRGGRGGGFARTPGLAPPPGAPRAPGRAGTWGACAARNGRRLRPPADGPVPPQASGWGRPGLLSRKAAESPTPVLLAAPEIEAGGSLQF